MTIYKDFASGTVHVFFIPDVLFGDIVFATAAEIAAAAVGGA